MKSMLALCEKRCIITYPRLSWKWNNANNNGIEEEEKNVYDETTLVDFFFLFIRWNFNLHNLTKSNAAMAVIVIVIICAHSKRPHRMRVCVSVCIVYVCAGMLHSDWGPICLRGKMKLRAEKMKARNATKSLYLLCWRILFGEYSFAWHTVWKAIDTQELYNISHKAAQ